MEKRPTTIDALATMITTGFTETQKYPDQQLDKMEGVLNDVVEELNATHDDMRYVRTSVTTPARSDAAHEAATESLRKRLERVERKVGSTQ